MPARKKVLLVRIFPTLVWVAFTQKSINWNLQADNPGAAGKYSCQDYLLHIHSEAPQLGSEERNFPWNSQLETGLCLHLQLYLIRIHESLVHKRLVRKSSRYLYAQAPCHSCGHQCWNNKARKDGVSIVAPTGLPHRRDKWCFSFCSFNLKTSEGFNWFSEGNRHICWCATYQTANLFPGPWSRWWF